MDYVESTHGKLELHVLPPYSPQLNPDEQVWKNVKERVAKQGPHDKYELRVMIRKALERLQQLPDIVRNFFNHPECGFVNYFSLLLSNWLQRGRYENTSHIRKCTEGIHKYSFAEGYEKSRSRECRVAGFSQVKCTSSFFSRL
jgi:hypothetical protein